MVPSSMSTATWPTGGKKANLIIFHELTQAMIDEFDSMKRQPAKSNGKLVVFGKY